MTWQDELRAAGTCGPNLDVDTDLLIGFLEDWAERCEFTIEDPTDDSVTIRFVRLPVDVDSLAEAIYEICPDTVEQRFGCLDEALAMFEEAGQEPPAWVEEMLDGLDQDDPKWGITAMARAIAREREIVLWWD